MTSWMLEGDGSASIARPMQKLGIAGIPCGIQGPKGGGWFRSDVNTVADLRGQRLRYGKMAAEVIARMGAVPVPLPRGRILLQAAAGQRGWRRDVDACHGCRPGFLTKLGLPYYMPGWQQPSALLDFLMRKDKWMALPPALRVQIETACQANIAWMLGRSPNVRAIAMEKLKASVS